MVKVPFAPVQIYVLIRLKFYIQKADTDIYE